jgi:hypothetical protein
MYSILKGFHRSSIEINIRDNCINGGVAAPPLSFFFLKRSLFIYFLINLYFFIKMNTCRYLID